VAVVGGSDSVHVKMEQERVAALFGQGLFHTLSNVVIGAIYAVAMTPAVGAGRAATWLGLMAAVTAARAGLWTLQRLRPAALSPHGWLLAFTVGGTINGLIWGASALLMWPPGAAHRALLGFVVGGMVAGSAAVVPAYLPAFYTIAAAALLTPIVRLLTEGGTVDVTMGVLLTTFGLAMTRLARRAGLWFVQNTELRLHNADLVAHLSEARDSLERRVKERTADLERAVELTREAEARARNALRDRNEFLATASHELRTPIATLGLHLSRLTWEREQPGKPTAAEASASLQLMHRQLRRLTGLVDTVLTASGAGGRAPPPTAIGETDLSAVVRAVVDDLTAHGRAPSIRLDLQEPLPGVWDAGRVELVVSNLVANAIKYGAGTPIDIHLTADNGGGVELTVTDQGPGIDPADLGRIFERFFRADVGIHPGGLGLGLAVVRELVEAMGGSVSVTSSPGQGATFTVTLPRPREPAQAHETTSAARPE
jgi:signal transduction histidine kinase